MCIKNKFEKMKILKFKYSKKLSSKYPAMKTNNPNN